MTDEISAGVLVYRWRTDGPEFLLVHPGGPFWARKDEAAWSIPKGLVEDGEATWTAAAREFAEELGQPIQGEAVELTPCRTPSRKLIYGWMVQADLDVGVVRSNDFEMEWPRRSGRMARFPEIDRAGYFDAATALWKIHRGQAPILREAISRLAAATGS